MRIGLSVGFALVLLAALATPAPAAQLGEGCTQDSDCVTPATKCLQLSTNVKICTLPCIPDDPQTPLINEDDCPNLAQYVCGQIPGTPGYQHCLQICTPSLTVNPCPPTSNATCDPASVRQSDYEHAVCFVGACASAQDCPVYSSKSCTSDTQCKATTPDAFCSAGTCARPGNCTAGGICGPHSYGKAGAQVGDPCDSDYDCPASGFCLSPHAGHPRAYKSVPSPNGYCTIPNCQFASSLAPFACPAGSACLIYFEGGLCLKSCSLATSADCRGYAKDRGGDYDCYAWNNLTYASGPLATTPVCHNAGLVPCNLFSSLDCTHLGEQNNPTNMTCRDRSDGTVKSSPKDPTGVCLDDTASGPYGPLLPDAGPDLGAPDAGPAVEGGPAPDTAGPHTGPAGDGQLLPAKDDGGCGCDLAQRPDTRLPWLALLPLALLLPLTRRRRR